MDRQYKRAEKVNVYRTRAEHEAGQPPLYVVHEKPYSRAGLDYYAAGGSVRPGWVDSKDSTADACVYLEGPGSQVKYP